AASASKTHAQVDQQVDVLQIARLLENVAPGIAPLSAETGQKNAAAPGHLEVRVGGHEGAADHVGAMADLLKVRLGGAPAGAGVHADAPLVARRDGRAEQVPFAAEGEVGEGAVEVTDGAVERCGAHANG